MCDIWQRDTRESVRAADLERHKASLQQLGVRHVVLTGGEPLLNNDLGSICEFFHEQHIRLTLLTTGLLLKKRAEEVAAGFDDIIVSIDGPAAIHDSIRRVPGAFELIGEGIAAVRSHRPQTEFIDVADPGVVADIDDPAAYQKLLTSSTRKSA